MDSAEHVAALEYELQQAKGVKPGGQPPNLSRVAAIEEAIRQARGGKRRGRPPKERLENADLTDDFETTEE